MIRTPEGRRPLVPIVTLAALLFSYPAVAVADPGRAGVTEATGAVYPQAPPGDQTLVPPGDQTDVGGPGGGPGAGPGPTDEPGSDVMTQVREQPQAPQSADQPGGAARPTVEGGPPPAPSPASGDGLAFTGLLAPLVLAVGIALLTAGVLMRTLVGRLRLAGPRAP